MLPTVLASVSIGTLLGFLFFAIAGLGKLLPGHPMYNVLASTFDRAIGPFFGLPATLLRLIIGTAELSAGLVFLVVPWSLYVMPDSLSPAFEAPSEALLLCAIIGMLFIMAGALAFNWITERKLPKVAPYIVFIALLMAFGYTQKQLTDFDQMPKKWMGFIQYFCVFCGIAVVVSLLWACKFGITIKELDQRMEEIHKMREQLL
eukprot:Skav233950  [mRNA]  locus=scaffold1382:164765:165761:+ [translate_table: standard]